jgi:hypothetical protein
MVTAIINNLLVLPPDRHEPARRRMRRRPWGSLLRTLCAEPPAKHTWRRLLILASASRIAVLGLSIVANLALPDHEVRPS